MSLVGWWSERPAMDYLAGGIAAVGYGVARTVGGVTPFVALSAGDRSTLYAAFMGAAGAVLAFVVVPAAIVLAVSPGPRLAYVLKTHPDDLRRSTVGGGIAALLGLATGLIALTLDVGPNGNIVARCLVILAAVVVFSGGARMLTIFAVLLKDIGVDRQDGVGSNTMPGPVAVPDPEPGESVRTLRAAST